MRLATFILSLFVFGAMLLQSCALYIGGSLVDEDTATSGAGGILVALLTLLAFAFVLPFPLFAAILYLAAALLAFGAGASDFKDMTIYGVVLLILAVMAFIGWLGKRKQSKQRQERSTA
jgi:ABC-type uncharacterized transport system permease subunit